MGPRVGELQPRHLERWRAAIVETMGASLAFPPFFAYRLEHDASRPLDRATRDGIEQFVRSANFSALDACEANSPEVRRFLERLLLRFLDVNPALRGAWAARRLPAMRTRVPKIAADLQRALLDPAGANGGRPDAAAANRSWHSGGDTDRRGQSQERNTRVLEAVLARGALDQPEGGAFPGAARPSDGRQREASGARPGAAPAPEPWARPTDATIPVPAHAPHGADGASPFASFSAGAQSGMFVAAPAVSERPTGPLPSGPVATQRPVPALPDDLYRLYGDYLRDMHPEATAGRQPVVAAPAAYPGASQAQRPAMQPRHDPAVYNVPSNGREPRPDEAAGPDVQIFYQLRFQLEAYVRRAVRGYGVHARGDDPSSQLDALRRSGFVDESDLRLAEGILAVTDKVIGAGFASVEDFRQAMMLYLLYHRSHLGS